MFHDATDLQKTNNHAHRRVKISGAFLEYKLRLYFESKTWIVKRNKRMQTDAKPMRFVKTLLKVT
jgi:hypothetical protein